MVCVSETNTYAFIPCRRRKTFLRKYLRTTALSDCPLTEVTADFPLPLQLVCCCPAHIYNQYVFIDNSDEILQKFEMTSSSPRSRQSMSCFHSGRVFSWLALSSMIRQQPYFSIQARSKVNVSYCSELNM